jgi:hypothetical protein
MKFGQFARAALEQALAQEKVPVVDFEERTHRFEGVAASG